MTVTAGIRIRRLKDLLATRRLLPACRSAGCPHCACARVHKWGTFSGRQRFRCTRCRRTFSTFTATPFQYLKRVDAWPTYMWCVDTRLPVRLAAAISGIHRDTAFRWRHRLLNHWRHSDETTLQGRIVVGEFRFPHSSKGRRPPGRPARSRGTRWLSRLPAGEIVNVLVARQSDRAQVMEVIGCRPLYGRDYRERLLPRLRDVHTVVGFRGPKCELAAVARRIGATYEPTGSPHSFFPGELHPVRLRLKSWLRRFRGVATRYLDNYLHWFGRESAGSTGLPRPPTVPADTAV